MNSREVVTEATEKLLSTVTSDMPVPFQVSGTHRWTFFRAGGVDQVAFTSGEDIVRLGELDPKLWVALACPTRGIEFDTRTLDMLDVDKDGRIRVPEIVAAVEWIKQVFKDPNELMQGGSEIALNAINESTPQGAAVRAGAARVVVNLGQPNLEKISLVDVADTSRKFAAAKLNGDGIVPADSAPDEELKKVIEEIIKTHGSVPDRSGKPGVNQALVDAFFSEANACSSWHAAAEEQPIILPLAAETQVAYEAMTAVRGKVDDFFTRVSLAEFDPRAKGPMNRAEADYVQFAARDLTIKSEELARLPLFLVEPNKPLPLVNGVNPGWAEAIANFRNKTVTPLLGNRTELSVSDWKELQARLAPYGEWLAKKPPIKNDQLGVGRLREVISCKAHERLNQLIKEDLALAPENAQLEAVEKMIRLKRDFLRLLKNFVSFEEFYRRRGSVFQAGTLYLDGRSCDLCVRVLDPAKHAALAGLAKAYLAYCDCTRLGGEKMSIAVAFTAGDSDYLMVGRNGVFFDREGRDWDATITKVIENPISIRQAFFAPYKKFVRMVEEQIAKRAAAADAEAQGKLSSVAADVATLDKTRPETRPAATPPTGAKKVDVGTVAALGVALGSISTVLVALFTKFVDLGWWIPLALLGLMLAISGPSVLISWLKLRQRNLGPILDANRWAVNGRMKINVPFGKSLSKTARLPRFSEQQLLDPFAEQTWKRNLVIGLILCAAGLLVGWRLGVLNRWLPESLQRNRAAQQVTLTNVVNTTTTNVVLINATNTAAPATK